MKTVLLTGFEPFGGAAINPSWEAVRLLDGWSGDGFKVEVRLLPCVFGAAAEALLGFVDALRPDIAIAVGLAGGRPEISIERIAINVDDARFPDNAGQQPIDIPIVADGPAAYFTTLPIKAMAAAIREQDIKAGVSQTAGTFVCNHVFYALMHHLRGQGVKAGFIHVPFLPEQAAAYPVQPTPAMTLEEIVAGLRVAVEVALVVERDAVLAGGATH
ncbi:Pyrrolidone-carboxylate peptidase [Massilia sp. Bi118]|uniref:pyroglutamyl-peptidase I n=1 Tax=Massilia sp. Bi118 TaxID=2822346 RepID=UPI001DE21325|nr:pyroglutamyl-peptidase I [Massilia sp. Bi118]CAH0163636.1 Pyrrolidone-carboxylate peptidase [Massilia sp. Bi118]